MALASCTSAPVICNNWVYQSPAMQQWLLIQLLNALLDTPLTIEQLQDAAAPYLCQGSPAKLNALAATDIAENLDGAVTAQPVCYNPAELSAMQTYLVCALLTQLSPPIT